MVALMRECGQPGLLRFGQERNARAQCIGYDSACSKVSVSGSGKELYDYKSLEAMTSVLIWVAAIRCGVVFLVFHGFVI